MNLFQDNRSVDSIITSYPE